MKTLKLELSEVEVRILLAALEVALPVQESEWDVMNHKAMCKLASRLEIEMEKQGVKFVPFGKV